MDYGYFKGEVCGRNRCPGIIDERETDRSCTCFQNAPCSKCTDSREYCPHCGWDGYDEQMGVVWPITNERRGIYTISVLTPNGVQKYIEDYTRSQAIADIQEIKNYYSPICRHLFHSDGTITIHSYWRVHSGFAGAGLYGVIGSFKWS